MSTDEIYKFEMGERVLFAADWQRGMFPIKGTIIWRTLEGRWPKYKIITDEKLTCQRWEHTITKITDEEEEEEMDVHYAFELGDKVVDYESGVEGATGSVIARSYNKTHGPLYNVGFPAYIMSSVREANLRAAPKEEEGHKNRPRPAIDALLEGVESAIADMEEHLEDLKLSKAALEALVA